MKSEIESKNRELRRKRQEFKRLKEAQRAVKHKGKSERSGFRKRKKEIQQEIFQLEMEIRAATERAEGALEGRTAPLAGDGSATGALPDFLVIGGKKCGTTFLYHLLGRHPHVELAASKELHYFDALHEQEDTEWYRRCFPTPKWKDGHRTKTGEATPYMANRRVPERVARVVPQVRLIALLRNPVDRAYSDYQQVVSKGREPRSFEEAIGLEGANSLDYGSEYLSRSVYVDQLLRWSEFFSKEQMLVLKSEDFFEDPVEILNQVLDFLDLPEWEPEAPVIQAPESRNKRDKRNRREYEGLGQVTRSRLEEYFEPHNKGLYDFVGVDFGW
jgi:sulfotransferase family protein